MRYSAQYSNQIRVQETRVLTDASLNDLVGLVYDAATEPQRWNDFLASLTTVLHATAASFDYFDHVANRGGVAAACGITREDMIAYMEYYSARNELWPKIAAAGLLRPGAVVENRSVYSDDEFARTEYCADFLEKRLGVFHAFGGPVLLDAAVSSNLSVLRPRSKPLEYEERQFMRSLMPHLQRSLAIWRRISSAEAERATAVEAMDHSSVPTLIIDETAAVRLMNAAARSIIRLRDGVAVDGTQLTVGGRALIVSPRVECVPRPNGKRPYVISIAPLRTETTPLIPQARRAFVVLISDPDRQVGLDDDRLSRMFGVTRTESRLASLLLEGRNLKEASSEMRIAVGTARVHLKRIMMKTQTRRQSELVLLLRAMVVQ